MQYIRPYAASSPQAVAGSTGTGTPILSAHAAGDLLVLWVESANETVTLSTANGWNTLTGGAIGTGTAAGTSSTRLTIFWIRCTSNAMAAPIIADAGDHIVWRTYCFRAIQETGTPIDVLATSVDAAATTVVGMPGGTTTVDKCWVLYCGAHSVDTTIAQLTPSATTSTGEATSEIMDDSDASGNGGGIWVVAAEKTTAGVIGTLSGTAASSGVHAYITIAIRPREAEADANVTDLDIASGGVQNIVDIAATEIDHTATGSTVYYRMRGVVSGSYVYWDATSIDSTASQYTGGGTPTNIVVVSGPRYVA